MNNTFPETGKRSSHPPEACRPGARAAGAFYRVDVLDLTRTHDAMVAELALVICATVTLFGGAFTSVMTRNTVLIGIGISRHKRLTPHRASFAVLTVVRGAALSVHLADKSPPPLFRGGGTWRRIGGNDPGPPTRHVMFGDSALVLGNQSGTILQLNVSGLTAHRTGRLATGVHHLSTTRQRGGRSPCVITTLINVAAMGSVSYRAMAHGDLGHLERPCGERQRHREVRPKNGLPGRS